ncbi:MAG TPA: aminoglycoside 6'-N-acetyltransferase [Rhizomicrobium sp.]|jgi:aminoglycoside 6'-N-acetyltransferase I|nr:aminoglycoside 6'-N-acetyltransferase [Rhizomicrobium sp.]
MRIVRAGETEARDWLAQRRTLWPEGSDDEHRADIAALGKKGAACFLAYAPDGSVAGFAEASLRRDYVNGCSTSPVGFLEGLHVEPRWRRQGVARLLVRAVERWALSQGCSELASDVLAGNREGLQTHAALGFEETDSVVYFRKPLV